MGSNYSVKNLSREGEREKEREKIIVLKNLLRWEEFHYRRDLFLASVNIS